MPPHGAVWNIISRKDSWWTAIVSWNIPNTPTFQPIYCPACFYLQN